MKMTIDTTGEAVNIAFAKIASGKNLIDTISMLLDKFNEGSLVYSSDYELNFKENKQRIKLHLNKHAYEKGMTKFTIEFGNRSHKEFINFLLINYLEHN